MQPICLTTLAEQQLDAARQATAGRSAHTIRGGRQHALHQTLLALVAGQGLDEHQSPGEASLQILRGRVRLATAEDAWEAAAGDYLDVPPQRHALDAIEDSVVLLTVITDATRGARV
jgi:quercetin dioxygenase-like cupin family protein